MKTDATDITFILDRSGSMESIREATISGFNRFAANQRLVPGEVKFTLIQFDDQYEVWHEAVSLLDLPELNVDTFVPRGSTALLDAIGRAIIETGQRLAVLSEPERPEHVICVILTDGLENASREFSIHQVNDLITRQRTQYSWDFLFLGANQDAIATAAGMGIGRSSSVEFAFNARSTKSSYDVIGDSVSKKRRRITRTTEIAEEDRDKLK